LALHPRGYGGRPHMRLSLPFGACSRVRPRSCAGASTRRLRRRLQGISPSWRLHAAFHGSHRFAPGVSPTRARRSAPCPDLPALFHTGYTLGVGFGPAEVSPPPQSLSPLGTAVPAAESVAHHPGVNPGGGPILSWTMWVPFKVLPRASARCLGTACPPPPAAEAPDHNVLAVPRPQRPPLGFAPLSVAPQPEGCGTAGGAVALRSLARLAAGRAPRSPADLHGVFHLVTGPDPEGSRPRRAMKQEPGLWVHLGGQPPVAGLRPPLRLRFQR
jgi:hypothetical protein